MQSFTVVDIGVLVIVLVSAILAYSRGVTREIFAILGWVAAAALAFMFARPAAPMVKQIPVLDKFLGDNCELAIIAGFFAVFAVALILASIFTPLFSSFIQRSALSGVDQGLGFLFGVVRGVALVAIGGFIPSATINATPVYEPLVFNTSLLVEYASSLTETAKSIVFYRYVAR